MLNIIDAEGARVTRLSLRGPENAQQYCGIYVSNSENVRLDHLDVRNFALEGTGYGVVAGLPGNGTRVDGLRVEASYFEHNRHGVSSATVNPDVGEAITGFVIRDNRFVNHTDAAIDNHAGTEGTQVINNTVRQGPESGDSADGILMNGLVDFLIEGNTIDMQNHGRHGILVQWVKANKQTEIRGAIRGNLITNVGDEPQTGEHALVVSSGKDADKTGANPPSFALCENWPPKETSHWVELESNTATRAENPNMGKALLWRTPPEKCGESPVDIEYPDEIPEGILSWTYPGTPGALPL